MENKIDLARLFDPFPASDVGWKVQRTNKKSQGGKATKGMVVPYVDNRAIMDRLDAVCGAVNWRNEFRDVPGGKGVLCGISIRIGDEWITKWDGAENTAIEPIKGGLSGSMKRAAVQWGIGRYLYSYNASEWVDLDDYGRPKSTPSLPKELLPSAVPQVPDTTNTRAFIDYAVLIQQASELELTGISVPEEFASGTLADLALAQGKVATAVLKWLAGEYESKEHGYFVPDGDKVGEAIKAVAEELLSYR